jgi:hypothetical protein
MKVKHLLFASVLVAASALTSASARADEVIVSGSGEGCTNCGGESKFHFGAGIFHRGSSCAGCGDYAWLNWHPGQGIQALHDSASAKIHAAIDCICNPTCKGAKANQPIPPQYLYNPYARSPRDYFMSER